MKQFEIIVERKLQHRFVIEARTSAEASMKLGAQMYTDGQLDPAREFEQATTTEVTRLARSPRIISDSDAPTQMELLRQGQTPDE